MHPSARFAEDVQCPKCGARMVVPEWPEQGDLVPFYSQDQPGAYSASATCAACGATRYMVWDEDPGPMLPTGQDPGLVSADPHVVQRSASLTPHEQEALDWCRRCLLKGMARVRATEVLADRGWNQATVSRLIARLPELPAPGDVPPPSNPSREVLQAPAPDGKAPFGADAPPLFAALLRNNYEWLRELLSAGADPNAVWEGDPLLCWVREATFPGCVALIVLAGADVHWRAGDGFRGVLDPGWPAGAVRLVLEAGTDPNQESNWGPVLFGFLEHGRIECIRLLVEYGANLAVREPRSWAPLHCAVARSGEPHELVRALIEWGVEINPRDDRGCTPLWLAATIWKPELVRLLLEAGADIRIPNQAGQTPLWTAAYHGCAANCELLIRAGADPYHEADERGKTPDNVARTEDVREAMWQVWDGLRAAKRCRKR